MNEKTDKNLDEDCQSPQGPIDCLKVSRATELGGRDRKIYRILEILPGAFSLITIIVLAILSYFKPVWVAYFIIAFDVYWLLLVIYMAIFLITSYRRLKKGLRTDWLKKCEDLQVAEIRQKEAASDSLSASGLKWQDVRQLIILPTYKESTEIIRECLMGLVNDGFPVENMIVALTIEERGGIEEAKKRAEDIKAEFGSKFGRFLVTLHPDGLLGEMKVKGANQAWAAKIVEKEIILPEKINQDRLLVSVFDIDTVVIPGYFFALTYKFLTVSDPYHASYQPVPVYHNNIWDAPFFSRIVASSNTFWQMIMQIRQESLVTYSSHSMTWRALSEIGFWSTTNVSEDARIFWHCLMHYNGHYRVEPLHFEVSMDVTTDQGILKTAGNLYKQQRRWAWGGENIPYLLFNAAKRWNNKGFDRGAIAGHIFIQIYGFHAWATNALIIAVIGWLPMLLGGDRFNSTVLSGNLPAITQTLMNIAMIGLVLSAVISSLLLPKRPKKYKFWKKVFMTLEWIFVPFSIVIFGAIPCLESQIRLMLGKYMGFWVTPKVR
ncbi:MAG: glycosyltransferase family 2 protein [Patescibacteria group bacterium]